MATNVTKSTEALVQNWVRTRKRVEQIKREISWAECDLLNASNELGKWLVPADAQSGETFHIWYGTGILQAKRLSAMSHDYVIEWRKKPDGKDSLEMES